MHCKRPQVPVPSARTAARFDSPETLLAHALLRAINGEASTPESAGATLMSGLGATTPEEAAAVLAARVSSARASSAASGLRGSAAIDATADDAPFDMDEIAQQLLAAASVMRGGQWPGSRPGSRGARPGSPPRGSLGSRHESRTGSPAIAAVRAPASAAFGPGAAPTLAAPDHDNPVARALLAAVSGGPIDQAELDAYNDSQMADALAAFDTPIAMPTAAPEATDAAGDAPTPAEMTRLLKEKEEAAHAAACAREAAERAELERRAAQAVNNAVSKLINEAVNMAREMQ
eukprot:267335-Chlamydomonas_euryale.AAC.1